MWQVYSTYLVLFNGIVGCKLTDSGSDTTLCWCPDPAVSCGEALGSGFDRRILLSTLEKSELALRLDLLNREFLGLQMAAIASRNSRFVIVEREGVLDL